MVGSGAADRDAVVRARRDDDAERLVELLARTHALDAYPVRGSLVGWAFLAGDVERAWVAQVDGRVEGHVCVLTGPDGPVLSRLFVNPDARGTGVGSALLDAVDAWADERGLALRLVVLDQDAAARRLYEQRGWQHVGSEPAAWLGGAGPWPLAHDYRRPAR